MIKIKEIINSNNRLSKFVIILTAFIALYTVFTDKFWKINFVITADMNGYYEYLPAVFIYNDINLNFVDTLMPNAVGMYIYEISPTNKRFIKYTCGVSYLAAPFFLTANYLSPIFNQPATGYSDPFEIAVILSGIFYFLAGLYLLRKTLLQFYNDRVVAITIFIIGLCSNLFYYSTTQPLMAHVYSFFTSTLFLYFLIQWHRKATLLNSLVIGLSFGLLVLLRPVNIIFSLVFIFYDIRSLNHLSEKLKLFVTNKAYLFTIAIFALLAWIPQLIYWKHISGQWLYFSYQQESFYFTHPYILKGLFGFRNGWLIYTPVMLLIFPGIFFLLKTAQYFFLPAIIFTSLYIIIILSWWCWWYVGYGNRAFIDAYALFSLPIAASVQRVLSLRILLRILTISIICFLGYLNLFQCWQSKYGILHYDSMTAKAYKAIFLKKQLPENFQQLLESPDYDGAKFHGKETPH